MILYCTFNIPLRNIKSVISPCVNHLCSFMAYYHLNSLAETTLKTATEFLQIGILDTTLRITNASTSKYEWGRY